MICRVNLSTQTIRIINNIFLFTNVRLENYFSYEDERVIFVSVLDRNNNI
jgi:hypothetical protein